MSVFGASLLVSLCASSGGVGTTHGSMHAAPSLMAVPVKRVPGRALLKLQPASKSAAAIVDAEALKIIGGRSGVDVSVVKRSVYGWLVVEVRDAGSPALPDEARTLELIDLLGDDADVLDVSEDKWLRPLASVNDPGAPQQWPLQVAHIDTAWDVTQGLSSQRIGVIDTGLIRGHEDMIGRVAGGFDFISNPGSSLDGGGRDADFQDNGDAGGGRGSFHGTHVAGTIAAATNNGVGVAGVNPNAQLVIVRALGLGGGDLVDIMEGAAWLGGASIGGVPPVGGNRVSVMNLSLGSVGGCSSFEQDVINNLDAAGIVFVAAAGNDSGAVNSPANCNNVVAVAAHGQTRALASYSSFGPQIDIVAPGGDQQQFGQAGGVLSSIGPGNADYGFFEGTSMAAPHITGIISLMQTLDPAMNRAKAEQLMAQTGQSCSNCGGRLAIDADAAVRATTPGAPDPDPDPVPDPDPLPVGGDDEFEENDDAGSGRNLACGSELDLIALPADQDWFDVSLAAGPLTLALTGGSPADLDLYVVNAGAIVARSENSGGSEAIDVQVQGSGILQILVNPFVDEVAGIQHTGPYHLSVVCNPGAPLEPDPDPAPLPDPDPADPDPVDVVDDDFEPNDTVPEALELFCEQESDDLTLNDDDWFFVDVREGDTLRVEKQGAGDVDVVIVDGEGATLANGAQSATARSLPEGRFLVHIPPGNPDAYTLRVSCTPPLAKPTAESGCGATSTGTWLSLFGLLLLLRPRTPNKVGGPSPARS